MITVASVGRAANGKLDYNALKAIATARFLIGVNRPLPVTFRPHV